MKYVNSSNIWKIDYDKQRRELYIIFINRKNWLYVYKNVPTIVWNNLNRASSYGVYFAEKIKNKYLYTRQITKHS